jgi:chorismate mutase
MVAISEKTQLDIDREIAEVLSERFQRAMIVGVAKALRGGHVVDGGQEDRVLEAVAKTNSLKSTPLPENILFDIFREIIGCAVDLQKNLHHFWPPTANDPNQSNADEILKLQRESMISLNERIVDLLIQRQSASGDSSIDDIFRNPDLVLWKGYCQKILGVIQSRL